MTTQKKRTNKFNTKLFFQDNLWIVGTILSIFFIISLAVFSSSEEIQPRNKFFPENSTAGNDEGAKYHLMLASSVDGVDWIKENVTIVEHCIKPYSLIGENGKTLLYCTFKNYPYADLPIVVGESDNGIDFDWYYTYLSDLGEMLPFTVGNQITGFWNGTQYIFYYIRYIGDDIPTIFKSSSNDGITFFDEVFSYCGNPLNFTSSIEPTISLINGSNIFVSKEGDVNVANITSRISSLIFFNESVFYANDINLIEDDLGYILFYSNDYENKTEIYRATSQGGYNWTEQGVIINLDDEVSVFDPSVIRINDSFWLMYYVAEINI